MRLLVVAVELDVLPSPKFQPVTVRNSGSAGFLNMFQATAFSTNTYFVTLAERFGLCRQAEIAEEMGMPIEELDSLLRQALTTSSLDAPVNGEEGRSFLGDLIADNSHAEPLEQVERGIHQEQLGRWLSHLTEQERQVLELRFGLEGEERHTLAEIGRMLDVSRERVRQVELKALRKLRHPTRLRQLMELSQNEAPQSGPGFDDFAKDAE